jgi:DNA-directed RNA polymerase specialized sigma24 family protein
MPVDDAAFCLSLHFRALDGDPVALNDLCDALLVPLVERLGRRYKSTCPHLVEQSVHEALIEYIKCPARYDPGRGPLPHFLYLAALADLKNALRREAKHHRGRVEGVELRLVEGNTEEGTALDGLVWAEEWAARQEQLRMLRETCSPGEEAVLDLMLAGERSTAAFAEALRLAHLPAEEQVAEVKRVKDRIKRRGLRGGAGNGAA